jgi:hypothetical protein
LWTENGFSIAGRGIDKSASCSGLLIGQRGEVVQLERVTVFGAIVCEVLRASECLLTMLWSGPAVRLCGVRRDLKRVLVLPPVSMHTTDTQIAGCKGQVRCFAPAFSSRRFGRAGYAQLARACPDEILKASENGAEVGAFASTQNTTRLRNLTTKLQEFMPVGLSGVIVAET